MSASVWRGAILLTIVAIVVKVMSAAYRIPYQNIAGDLGFYVYQQIYPFFAVAVYLAAYGFPAAISKLTAAKLAEGDRGGASEVVVRSFLLIGGFSILVFLGLFFGAPWISYVMGDPKLVAPLRVVAFSFLLISPVSAIRGFFQGYGVMKPTASSQILEQFVRAALIIGFTLLVSIHGLGAYAAGVAAGGGSVAGMLASCILLLFIAAKHRVLLKRKTSAMLMAPLIKALAFDGLAFSISSLVLVLFLLIDTFTVLQMLSTSSVEARIQVGIYDRGYPLVQLATAAAISFSLAFIPAMARAKVQGDHTFIQEKSELALRLCLAFGAAAVVGFGLIAKSCNIMLFTDDSGSTTLAWFGFSIVFSMIAMASAGILQALGHTRTVLLHTLSGLVVKLGFNLILIPVWGTFGAATSSVIAFALIAGLNGFTLHRKTEAFSFLKQWPKITAALLFMALTVYAWRIVMGLLLPGMGNRMFATVVALGGSVSGAAVYLVALLRFGFFSKSELVSLSKKEKSRRTA